MKKGKRDVSPEEMSKPKYKVGEIVTVDFLGSKRTCKLTELRKNPQNIERWIYTAKDIHDNRIITYIGINGTEKFANINDEPEENLESTKE